MQAVGVIPKYTSKDNAILVATMGPMAVVLNYILFGSSYFYNIQKFLIGTASAFLILSGAFITYGLVAISLRNRFPNENQLYKRLLICISLFALMTAVIISLILRGYEHFGFLDYTYSENDFAVSYAAFFVVNVFLTFLNEGIYQFEKYANAVRDTEELKKEYMQSQLLGLKSQMNPHFLFNGLNTLSSLIHEHSDDAEDFLDHMSKVYRYLLRNTDEKLVTLQTELQFIQSYYYLLKKRHGDGLILNTAIAAADYELMIPPLTLQMIIENILNGNAVSKQDPLIIFIETNDQKIFIRNSLFPKKNATERDRALDNINNKYRLLCQQGMKVITEQNRRTIELPLIIENTVCV